MPRHAKYFNLRSQKISTALGTSHVRPIHGVTLVGLTLPWGGSIVYRHLSLTPLPGLGRGPECVGQRRVSGGPQSDRRSIHSFWDQEDEVPLVGTSSDRVGYRPPLRLA